MFVGDYIDDIMGSGVLNTLINTGGQVATQYLTLERMKEQARIAERQRQAALETQRQSSLFTVTPGASIWSDNRVKIGVGALGLIMLYKILK